MARKKKEFNILIYDNIYKTFLSCIESVGNNLLKFDNLPDTINTMQVSKMLSTGLCGIHKFTDSINNGWVCCPAYGIGVERENGTFAEYELVTDTGAITVNENDCYIIRNGYNKINTQSIFKLVAYNLTEIVISERKLIKHSRSSPIIKTNSFSRNGYEETCRNIFEMNTDVNIVTDDSAILTENTNSKNDTILHVTDPTAIQQMHFLSEYFYEQIRRVCTFFGLPFSTNAKSSQNLIDELHDMDILSQFLGYSVLSCIKEDITRGNKITGLEITVDYSPILKKQIERIDKVGDEIENTGNTDRRTDNSGENSTDKSDNSDNDMARK